MEFIEFVELKKIPKLNELNKLDELYKLFTSYLDKFIEYSFRKVNWMNSSDKIEKTFAHEPT